MRSEDSKKNCIRKSRMITATAAILAALLLANSFSASALAAAKGVAQTIIRQTETVSATNGAVKATIASSARGVAQKGTASTLAAAVASANNTAATSAIPAFSAPVSSENALAVAATYDADGAYILQDGIQHGDDISTWLSGSRSNAEALDTAVHEETHTYSWNHGTIGWHGMSEAIYIGSGQAISVPQTSVVKTEEWAQSLPASLQTFRYSTYVAPGATVSANQNGIYGLLNEFNAYSWGMNNQIALFNYYKTGSQTFETWMQWVNQCENNYQAFCEFRFWTLGYLAYVQKAHPQVWIDIMSNQNYINAYCFTERRFENLIAMYKALRGQTGFTFSNGRMIEQQGRYTRWANLMSPSQTLLLQQIAQPDLAAQEQYMFAHCSVDVLPAQDVTP